MIYATTGNYRGKFLFPLHKTPLPGEDCKPLVKTERGGKKVLSNQQLQSVLGQMSQLCSQLRQAEQKNAQLLQELAQAEQMAQQQLNQIEGSISQLIQSMQG
jgi:flagellar biosynthesis/type III secretory pathway chaperone